MKTKILCVSACIVLGCTFLHVSGQDTIPDPVLEFKRFTETGYFLGYRYLDWKYINEPMGSSGSKYLGTTYYPNFEIYRNWGWFLKKGRPQHGIFKPGIALAVNGLNYEDSLSEKLRRSDLYLRIPLMFGVRENLNHSRFKGNMYRAVELYFGPYLTLPMYSFYVQSNDYEIVAGRQYVVGMEAEIYLTSQNPKGHGHRFGLKSRVDITTIDISDSVFGEAPLISTIGLFYNIGNNYKSK